MLVCEDCGEEVPKGRRRVRCARCERVVCSYCYHHIHVITRRREGDVVVIELPSHDHSVPRRGLAPR